MSKTFDFVITASDEASAAIDRIKKTVDELIEPSEKAKKSLQFDDETINGLDEISGKLKSMSTWARDNVQFIGDMVPPLKMVGGLTLGVGAVAGGVYALGKGLRTAGKAAYELNVNAKNAGMRVDDFQALSGAMRIIGNDAESAEQSVGGLYATFNNALQGRSPEIMSLLSALGVDIAKHDDGTADVLKTVENLSKVFSKLSTQNQKTVADMLGLTPEVLSILREGENLTNLLSQAKELGFVTPQETLDKLDSVNTKLNTLSATWEGLKNKASAGFYDWLLSDGSIEGAIEGATGLLEHGPDNVSLMGMLGFNKGGDAEKLRKMYNDKDFRETLDWSSDAAVYFGNMTDDLRKKYADYYENPNGKPIDWNKTKLTEDEERRFNPVLADDPNNVPEYPKYEGELEALRRQWYPERYKNEDKSNIDINNILSDGYILDRANAARGIRNNNPLNIEKAPNIIGKDSRFAKFATAEDGISAATRQIMLHFERGNDNISSLIHKWAPPTENDTFGYINYVSKQTGLNPYQSIDMSNPEILQKLIVAMTKQENGGQMPYSQQELTNGITSGLYDPRWHGLRKNPVTVNESTASSRGQNDIPSLTDAFKKALSESKMNLEITMIDQKTGLKRKVDNNSGRIAVAMPTLN